MSANEEYSGPGLRADEVRDRLKRAQQRLRRAQDRLVAARLELSRCEAEAQELEY